MLTSGSVNALTEQQKRKISDSRDAALLRKRSRQANGRMQTLVEEVAPEASDSLTVQQRDRIDLNRQEALLRRKRRITGKTTILEVSEPPAKKAKHDPFGEVLDIDGDDCGSFETHEDSTTQDGGSCSTQGNNGSAPPAIKRAAKRTVA